ncbi:hypothetical protein CVD25_08400 [Bacillus canaveralius]|uniref:Uncharacterized protein n=1 Tax=Bacillus canaveralius TaxID=1403243 RepID=A0A2N5GIC8_9BACI|nr:hypothetical protein [Bacillus canaveralius]PLR80744.1 hypothetical protein CU635_16970 [Bacillus canaveralius]PLR98378.1 hypothetical protein CVD25_08400 [Bacillus canaveralius]
MFSSDHEEIRKLIEALLKQYMENANKDSISIPTAQTVINFDNNGIVTYLLLYLMLNHNISGGNSSKQSAEQENPMIKQLKKLINDVDRLRQADKNFYDEILNVNEQQS